MSAQGKELSDDDSLEERDKKYRFGIARWTPDVLQVFRHPIAFTSFLFVYGVVEGAIVSGLTSVVITSIERRYNLTSIMTGILASIFDVVVVICVLPMSYFGEKGHKPRWLGIGAVVHALGALLFAFPQFVGGPYLSQVFESNIDLCHSEVDFSQDCNKISTHWVYFIFILAIILMAIGAAPLFTVGIAFIDDIVWPKKVSVYLGAFQSSIIIGPAIGYVLGGGLLLLYVDPFVGTSLTSRDPSFVGMWWAGFIILGILTLLIAVPILMYPREIPQSVLIRRERMKYMTWMHSEDKNAQTLRTQLKKFPRQIINILSSPSWFLVTLTGGLTDLIVAGFASFGPKYVEVQFGVSSSAASYGVGGVGVVLGGAGIITGGVIVFCLKGTGKKAALLVFITTLISTLSTLGLFLNCPNTQVTGIPNNTSLGYLLLEGGSDAFNVSCTAGCNCTSSLYQPVCHRESQLTYYSPCHAGCQHNNITMPGDMYTDCSCLLSANSTTTAFDGKCGQCDYFIPFLVLLGAILFVTFTALVPITIVTVRSVAEEQRCTALGFQSVLFRLLGGIPGPLTFGAIFDSSCILWQYECGSRGNCWEYNNASLMVRLFSYTFTVCAARTVTVLFAWLMFGRTWCHKKVGDKKNENHSPSNPEFAT